MNSTDQLPSGLTKEPTLLTLEAKHAVNKYLYSWAVIVGIANFAAFVSLALYAWFAIDGIKKQAQEQVDREITTISKNAVEAARQKVSEDKEVREMFVESLNDSLLTSGKIGKLEGKVEAFEGFLLLLEEQRLGTEKKIENETQRLAELNQKIENLDELLSNVRKNEFVKVVGAVDKFFSENPDTAKQLVGISEQIEAINSKLKYVQERRDVELLTSVLGALRTFESPVKFGDLAICFGQLEMTHGEHDHVRSTLIEFPMDYVEEPMFFASLRANEGSKGGDSFSIYGSQYDPKKKTLDISAITRHGNASPAKVEITYFAIGRVN